MTDGKKMQQSDIAEDALESVGKAARGVWDFLTSPDDAEFLRKVDERHGTNLGALHARIKAGPGASTLEPGLDRAIDKVGRTIDVKADVADSDNEIVIVVEEDLPCDFCKGKQVIQLKGQTRTAIKCPTCKKSPASRPKALGK